MRKSHTNIVKFLNLLPEISLYAQTDGADNNKTPTHLQIDATKLNKCPRVNGLPVSVNLNKQYNNKFVIFFNIKFFRLRKFLK